MTATSVPTTDSLHNTGEISKGAFDLDYRAALSSAGILVLSLWFVALCGIPVGLNDRTLVKPVLSLGYLSLLWLPLLFGWLSGNETVLEGMVATKRGARDIVRGLMVGLVGGLGLSLLLILVDSFDLRDPLVNWSPALQEFLQIDRGIGFGIVAWPILGAVLGAFGASLQVMPEKIRKALLAGMGAVLGFAVFATFIVDIADFLDDLIYAKRGGLKWVAAIILFALAASASYFGGGRKIGDMKSSYHAATGPAKKQQTTTLILLSVAALIVIPLITGKITQELFANIGIFLLLALGLNIVVGLAGILDLGYVAFFAVGGYTTAVLTSPNRGPDFEGFPTLPWWAALLVTIFVAALVGLFIGAPVIRMRGDYLAIVTLGFGEIIRLLFLSDWLNGWFNGAQGITNVPPADFGFFSVKGTDPRSVFYLVMFFAAISIYVSWRLERSRLGRAWMAIREDESVAEAMGINTVNMKLMAFVVGAVLASFSGAIFAAKVGSIFPTSFLILVSVIILVVVIVGGMGNIMGIIVGSVVLIGVLGGPKQPGLLAEFAEYKLLIYGALLVVMMLKRPEGLVPNVRRSRELHQDEFLQDAWLKGEVDTDDDDMPADPSTSGLSGNDEGTVAPA